MSNADIIQQAMVWGFGIALGVILQVIIISLSVYFGLKLYHKETQVKKG